MHGYASVIAPSAASTKTLAREHTAVTPDVSGHNISLAPIT